MFTMLEKLLRGLKCFAYKPGSRSLVPPTYIKWLDVAVNLCSPSVPAERWDDADAGKLVETLKAS